MDNSHIKDEIKQLISEAEPIKNRYLLTIACSLLTGIVVQSINYYLYKPHNNPPFHHTTASLYLGDTEIKPWSRLTKAQKKHIRAETFSLFPHIFLRRQGANKWGTVQQYLRTTHGITHSNIRDIFRGKLGNFPAFEAQAIMDQPYIYKYLSTAPKSRLIMAWGESVHKDKYQSWLAIVARNIEKSQGSITAQMFKNEMLKNQQTKKLSHSR